MDRALPRLLAAAGDQGQAMALARHRRAYPAPPLPGRPRDDFIATVERSGLRGRGGAAFPTGTKLRAVREGRRSPVVVVNGAEGEPASGKDKLLLATAPHLVLDGALLAAAAVGAGQVIVCVDHSATAALGAVTRALAERRGSEATAEVRLAPVPSRYVAGEETALVRWLNGGPATPTRTPPRPFQHGVDGRATLVDNVETLAHLAQVLRFGPDWFRQLGTPDEPGSTLVTLSGAVARPGVYELPMGVRLADVLGLAGPAERRSSTPGARRYGSWSPQDVEARHRYLTGALAGISAVLVGGYFGSWLGAGDAGHARLDNRSLRPRGAGLGCGAIVVLAEDACGLDETARILTWLAGQTAGQCGPCVYGLAAIAATTTRLRDGRADGDALAHLRRWTGQVEGRGGCRMPDGAVRLLRSALRVFADDVQHHLAGRPCAGAAGSGGGPGPRVAGVAAAPVPVPARTNGASPWS